MKLLKNKLNLYKLLIIKFLMIQNRNILKKEINLENRKFRNFFQGEFQNFQILNKTQISTTK